MLNHRQPVLVTDTSRDQRWLVRPDDLNENSTAKSAMCVPLLAREQLVGILTLVHPTPNRFNSDQLELISAIGAIAGAAIQNAQLYDLLNAAHRRYYELFEDSIDPILITGLDGNIVEANRQAEIATAYLHDELHARSIYDLLVDRDEENPPEEEGQPALVYETGLRRKVGDPLPVEVYARTIRIDGQPHWQWIARDISARKKLQTLQEDLSSMIYHDLRSPLANVVSSLDMLEALLPNDRESPAGVVLRIARRSTERVQRLINSLLDIRRLEAGQPIATRRWVNLPKLFDEALEFVQPVTDGRHQPVQLELEGSFPPMWVDGDMLRRVLVNLVENASKFTPTRGQIVIGARAEGDLVRFWVRDSGPGIPPEALPTLFDKFTSVQTEQMPRGMGLGLAFCRLAVQAHGGEIWVDSVPGQGSTFFFTLPVHSDV